MPANSRSWSRSATQFNCTLKMSTCLGLNTALHLPPGNLWQETQLLSLIRLKIHAYYLGVCLVHSKRAKEILADVTIITLLGNAPALIYPNFTSNVFLFVVKHTQSPSGSLCFPNQFHPALVNSFVPAFTHSFTK